MKSETATRAPDLAAAFRDVGTSPCVVCGKTSRRTIVDPHHVLPAQAIRLYVQAHPEIGGAEAARLMWSLENRLVLCRQDHDRATTGKAPIPWEMIPEEAKAFAHRLGMLWRLEKLYPRMERPR
jgi:hypothetical protein